MKALKVLLWLFSFFSVPAAAQSKIETIANFGTTSADMAMTCYNQHNGGRELWTPSQNCAVIASLNYGRAAGAFFLDRYLDKHNHPKWAHFQLVSAGISANGFRFSFQYRGGLPSRYLK